MHGEREGNWFLASTSAPRWVEGWLERVKGEGWWKGGVDWLWLRFNFLSEKHVGEGRPDCENSSQWCFLSSALYRVPLQFVTGCFILFQRNCPVLAHKYPTAEIQQRIELYHSIIFQHKLLTFKSIPRWDIPIWCHTALDLPLPSRQPVSHSLFFVRFMGCSTSWVYFLRCACILSVPAHVWSKQPT